jgi:hypothetical protein
MYVRAIVVCSIDNRDAGIKIRREQMIDLIYVNAILPVQTQFALPSAAHGLADATGPTPMIPLAPSARWSVDGEMPERCESARPDKFNKARAALICAEVICVRFNAAAFDANAPLWRCSSTSTGLSWAASARGA